MLSKQNKTLSATIVSQYDYTVNSIGQRVSRTQSGAAFDGIGYAPGTTLPPSMTGVPGSGTSTDTFTYNARGEVTGSTNLNSETGNPNPSLFRGYDYDPIGNRLLATENTETETYVSNNLNQYISVTSGSSVVNPVFDDDGNMLSDGEGKTYTWDCENRLIQVTLPNDEIVRYSYDGQSRRVKREHITSTDTETTTYLYDDWNVIAEWHSPNSDTQTLKSYLWGLDLGSTFQGAGGVGGLLASIAHNPSTLEDLKTYSFTYDGNGNVSELVGSDQTIQAHYEYDIFGNEIMIVGIYGVQNGYRFSTKLLDTATKLNYYGYRFYQSKNGRWINRDPLEETVGSLYSMAENDLSNNIDFLGLILFAIGGTESAADEAKYPERTSVKRFYNSYMDGDKEYVDGPDGWRGKGFGKGLDGKVEQGMNFICKRWCANQCLPIDLVGHSRGGHGVILIAEKLEKEGCFCPRNGGIKKNISVRFMGLYDAVAMHFRSSRNVSSNVDFVIHALRGKAAGSRRGMGPAPGNSVDWGNSGMAGGKVFQSKEFWGNHSAIGGIPNAGDMITYLGWKYIESFNPAVVKPRRKYWDNALGSGANMEEKSFYELGLILNKVANMQSDAYIRQGARSKGVKGI